MIPAHSVLTLLSLGALVLGPISALADQPAPPYAPITINEADYKALQAYLGDQPMKFSAPIATWLASAEVRAEAEARAKADADAAAAKKVEPPGAPK